MLSERLRGAGFSVVSPTAADQALAAKGIRPGTPGAAKQAGMLTNAKFVITGSFSMAKTQGITYYIDPSCDITKAVTSELNKAWKTHKK